MTNEEILTKVIKKAVEGGWFMGKIKLEFLKGIREIKITSKNKENAMAGVVAEEAFKYVQVQNLIPSVIFDQDFAKAFWGEGEEHQCHYGCCKEGYAEWEMHLTNMVLDEQPLKYLERFLEGERDDKDKPTRV